VKWTIDLPGPGNSSPIVWDDQIFVTCASQEGRRRSLMCFNRTDGQLTWERHVAVTADEPTHETNPYCSSSPVTDGQVVIAWHDAAGLHAYDLFGKPLWEFDPRLAPHVWGSGASPVIVDDLVILNCGATTRPFVVAVNKTTGKQVWRYDAIDSRAPNKTDFWGSWSTPVVLNGVRKKEIIVHLPRRLDALDAQTGTRTWTARGPGPLAYTTPLVGTDLIVATSGYHGPALAVRRGGENDITPSHRLWLDDAKNPQRVGTGVLVDKHVYILNEPGIAWCLEAATGEILWKQRLGAKRSWNSTVYAEGRLYMSNTSGTTFVLEPDPTKCHVLAENHLNELTRASPAFSDGQIFIRTWRHLHCLESP
jgi:outer membrane protein assembly factor BamB